MSFEIRQATSADAAAIAGVQVSTWKYAYRGQVPDDLLEGMTVAARTIQWMQILTKFAGTAFVATSDGAVIGFCSVGTSRDEDADEAVGEVNALYVHPDSMGRGAGSWLLGNASRFLEAQGYRRATLWVLTSNTRSRKFYERHGWRADGATKVDPRGLQETRYACEL